MPDCRLKLYVPKGLPMSILGYLYSTEGRMKPDPAKDFSSGVSDIAEVHFSLVSQAAVTIPINHAQKAAIAGNFTFHHTGHAS